MTSSSNRRWLFCTPTLVWLGALALGLYATMLTVTVPALAGLSGGQAIFDLRPGGYDESEARALLDALGAPGRSEYLHRQLLLDWFYPPTLGLWLVALFGRFAEGFACRTRLLRWYAALAVAIVALDYLENVQIAGMLAHYPELTAAQVARASATTIAKSAVSTVGFTGLLLAGIAAGWRARRRSR